MENWRLEYREISSDDEVGESSFDDTVFATGCETAYLPSAILVATGLDVWKDIFLGDGKPSHCTEFALSDFPALYRDFASIYKSSDSIFDFAQKYGFLGLRNIGFYGIEPSIVAGEYLSDWVAESHKFSILISLWDGIKSGRWSAGQSDDRIAKFGGGVIFIDQEDLQIAESAWSGSIYEEFDLILSDHQNDESFDEFLARSVLHNHLLLAIESTCSPDFSLVAGTHIRLTPSCLLGGMYLQFLNEIIGRPDPINKCPVCGLHFKAENSAKIFCSNKCKMKAYRRSKKVIQNGS